jgi:hypothetical protein
LDDHSLDGMVSLFYVPSDICRQTENARIVINRFEIWGTTEQHVYTERTSTTTKEVFCRVCLQTKEHKLHTAKED